MVDNPEKSIPFFLAAGAEWISFHIETKTPIEKTISLIRQVGSKPGLALNPDTPVERVYPFLPDLDYVLLMSVFPGYGGQKFMEASMERIRQLKRKILADRLECRIEVDGGFLSAISPGCGMPVSICSSWERPCFMPGISGMI